MAEETLMRAAFPVHLTDDAVAVTAALGSVRLATASPFTVSIGGEPVTIPYRIYGPKPTSATWKGLMHRQRLMLHCWYTRHHDGHVRQRHLAEIINVPLPWVAPFVVRLTGEYVIQILEQIRDSLVEPARPEDPLTSVYGAFGAENPAFLRLTRQRVASYWDCYFRRRYLDFNHSPGKIQCHVA